MKIQTPKGMRYPCIVQELHKKKDADVTRGDKLFKHYYEETVTETNKIGIEHKRIRKQYLEFDATTEGTIAKWFIKPGTVLDRHG